MKFKPIYLYGLLLAAVVIVLIFVVQENSNETVNINRDQSQNMPDDQVHKQLQNQDSNSPSKKNVTESFKKKLSELKTTVGNNPEDTLVMREYADLLTASHKMDEAIVYYNKILEKNKRRTDIYFSLSLIYYNKNDFVNAEDQNKKVLRYDAQNQMALYNIGAIAATQGDIAKAKDLWDKVIKIDPKSETGNLAMESLVNLH